MKKNSLLALLLLTAVSCNEFDDSAIWDKLDNHEARIVQLETMCNQMNTNISSLQTIVQSLQKNDYVTSIISIVENGKEIGYSISFSSGITIKIYHGNDGKDGNDGTNDTDGQTPAIGTRQDADGIYYWTVNGEWLLDDSGNKIPTTGKDGTNGADGKDGQDGSEGITPQLKIEEDYWYISYDNGATWTQLGKATGEDGANGTDGVDGKDGQDGDSMFSNIDITGTDYVIFTLADGTQIKIPTWKAFENLQTMVNQMNTNIEALQTIVEVLQSKDYVTSVTPLVENNLVIGYSIAFDKSGEIVIYHGIDGQDGEDGKDGATPEIGIRQDSDGLWYWTLNGEWLLDESGSKVPAAGKDGADGTDGENGSDGKDGIVPQLKIEDGYWYVSYDEGTTWQVAGEASSTESVGSTLFKSMTQDDQSVTLILADDTSITIPKVSKFDIVFENTTGILYSAGDTTSIPFTIIGGTGSITIECIGNNNWEATASMTSETAGEIKVIAPEEITGKVLVLASNGNGQVAFKSLTFEEKILTMITDAYQVSEAGGTVEVSVSTNMEYTVNIPSEAQSWLTHTATKAVRTDVLEFTVSENPDEAPRTADIEIISTDGTISFTITIVQETYASYEAIEFADEVMKELCVAAFDTNGDGELSYREAAAVTDLSQMTLDGKTVKSFDEFQYFTGISNHPIPSYYFNESGIESIILPENLTYITNYVFEGCSTLISITLPISLRRVGSRAFYNCPSLKNVYLKGSTPPYLDFGTPFGYTSDLKFYVPSESVETYKTSESWSSFADYIVGYDFENNIVVE